MEFQINLRSGSNFYVSARSTEREARALHRGRHIATNVFGGVLLMLVAVGCTALLAMNWVELDRHRAVPMMFIGASVIGLLCLPPLVRWQLKPIWIVKRRDDGVWLTMGGECQRVQDAAVGMVEMTGPPGSEGRLAHCRVMCQTDDGSVVEVLFVGSSSPQAGEEAAVLAAAIKRLSAM